MAQTIFQVCVARKTVSVTSVFQITLNMVDLTTTRKDEYSNTMVIMIKHTNIKIYKRYHILNIYIYIICVLTVNLKEKINIHNISGCPECNKHEIKFYLYQASKIILLLTLL